MKYKYSKKVGALQEAQAEAPPPVNAPRGSVARSRSIPAPNKAQQPALPEQTVVQQAVGPEPDMFGDQEVASGIRTGTPMVHAQAATDISRLPRHRRQELMRESRAAGSGRAGTSIDHTRSVGGASMFHYTVDDGQRVLMVNKNGSMEEIRGPKRVWRLGRKFIPMQHHVAHPGEFLIVRFRDGEQEHLAGPSDIWLDPRTHVSAEKEESLPIATKEAVVAYSKNDEGKLERRVVHGPATFVPQPGEWLHTFSWHGSAQTHDGGYRKIPNALVFQKLWLLPDQMYHDVTDVRTSDDAVLTIRLMIFFELVDIETMLDATHDPIGDFVNAASSDVVEFVGKHDFNTFKQNTDKLNDLDAYKQLVQRAQQTGYRINKVVYRGYGAPENIQEMHDQAIESRTRLALEKATEEQAQELEDYKLDRELAREAKQRQEKGDAQDAELAMMKKRRDAELDSERARRELVRSEQRADTELELSLDNQQRAAIREHLDALKSMDVDLTAYLTQARADQVIELRGGNGSAPHVHLNGDHFAED